MERDDNGGVVWYTIYNFNSHAHVERDIGYFFRIITDGYFNSHAHVERDAESCNVATKEEDFNSHAHVERDHTLSINYSV